MKVFISWSGERSKIAAKRLSVWLPRVIQRVKTFYSEDDIEKGGVPGERLIEELDSTSFGILCLTPENLKSEWLHFEAGAIFKKTEGDRNKVCPLLFNFEPNDLPPGPLKYFTQAATFDEESMLKLLTSLNNALEVADRKPDSEVEIFFKKWWDEIKDLPQDIGKIPEGVEEPRRSDRDLLGDILSIVRATRNASGSDDGSTFFEKEQQFIRSSLARELQRLEIDITAVETAISREMTQEELGSLHLRLLDIEQRLNSFLAQPIPEFMPARNQLFKRWRGVWSKTLSLLGPPTTSTSTSTSASTSAPANTTTTAPANINTPTSSEGVQREDD